MKELAKKESTEVAVASQDMSGMFGADSGITMEDCTIGRLGVMNALSDFVADEKFKQGDIINFLTEEKLGDSKSPVEFIPIKATKYWIEKEGDTFVARYPATRPNEKQWVEGNITRTYHHSFYVLLPSDMKDGGFPMPTEISFRSTELGTARKLSSFILKMWMMKKPTWGKVFNLTTVKKTKDTHKWFGTALAEGRESTQEEMDFASMWKQTLDASSEVMKHTEEAMVPDANEGESVDHNNSTPTDY